MSRSRDYRHHRRWACIYVFMPVAMFAQRSCAPQHLAGADSSAHAGADSAPHSSAHAMPASPTTPSDAVPSTPSGAGPSTPPGLLKLKEPIFVNSSSDEEQSSRQQTSKTTADIEAGQQMSKQTADVVADIKRRRLTTCTEEELRTDYFNRKAQFDWADYLNRKAPVLACGLTDGT